MTFVLIMVLLISTKVTFIGGSIAVMNSIVDFVQSRGGVVTAAEATSAGFARESLRRAEATGKLVRWERGVYALPEMYDDEMYALQKRYSKGIFSNMTALYLHGLSDRAPLRYDMTFPDNYNTHRVPRKIVRVHYAGGELYSAPIMELETPYAHLVNAYDMERTLCDVLRPRVKADKDLVANAFRVWADLPSRNIIALSAYSKMLAVEDKVRAYLEVLT